MITPDEQTDLVNLNAHWGEEYSIAILDSLWVAVPTADVACTITAETAYELKELMRADYAERHAGHPRPLSGADRMST